MKPSGVLILLTGAWVLCQVLGGNALNRMNILGQVKPQQKQPNKQPNGGDASHDNGNDLPAPPPPNMPPLSYWPGAARGVVLT